MSTRTDILVVGGGLVGPLVAIALADAGLGVTVVDTQAVETRRDAAFDGRAYALSAASINMLSATGLWRMLASEAQPIREIKVSDGRAGEGAAPAFLHFDLGEIDDGPFGHMVEDRFLRRALLERMESAGVTHLAGHRATGLSEGVLSVEGPAGPQILEARLVIGCDGRRSQIAEFCGIRRNPKDYGQTALVAAIAHERPHRGIAHQFFTPSGPLAILPLPGERSSIVWTERNARAAEIARLDDEDFIAALRPVFGTFLGDISLAGARFSYPLNLSLANRLTGARVALAGDAAHGIHPIAGQGLNLGIRDAAALAEVVVTAARRGEDIGAADVLERYAAWRRFDIATMALVTDGVNALFSNDNPVLRLARDAGLAAVSALPGLRRALMREAAGLTGDRPRLLSGRTL